jgi:hypothetical protein
MEGAQGVGNVSAPAGACAPDARIAAVVAGWFPDWLIWWSQHAWHARRISDFAPKYEPGAPAFALHEQEIGTLAARLAAEEPEGAPGTIVWECELPRAEAKWLAGEHGPLSGGNGRIVYDGGLVGFDQVAFDHLAHLGTVSDQDGGIVYRGEMPYIAFDPVVYQVRPVGPQP